MIQRNLSAGVAALSLACAQLPAISHGRVTDPQSQKSPDPGHQPELKNATISEIIRGYEQRRPNRPGAAESLLVNSWMHTSTDVYKQAERISAKISDDMRVFYTARPTAQAEGLAEGVKDSIRGLSRHLWTRTVSGTESNLVVSGTGSILLLSALKQLDSELTEFKPAERREALRRIHVVFLGDPGEAHDTQAKRDVRLAEDPIMSDLGSVYLLRRIDGEGLAVDDSGASAATIQNEIIPELRFQMFQESGVKDIPLRESVVSEAQIREEMETARSVMRQISERITSEETKANIIEIELAAAQLTRDDLKNRISATLENLRSLEYTLDQTEASQDRIADKMRQIARVLNETERALEELKTTNALNKVAVKKLALTVRSIQTTLIRYALTKPRDPLPVDLRVLAPVNDGQDDFDRDGVPDTVENNLLDKFVPIPAFDTRNDRVPVTLSDYLAHSNLASAYKSGGRKAALEMLKDLKAIDMTPKDWRADGTKSIWYARCCKPQDAVMNIVGKDVYVLQYYALYSYNSCPQAADGTLLVDLIQPIITGTALLFGANPIAAIFIGGIFDVSIQSLNGQEREDILGNHEADLVYVQLVVDAADADKPVVRAMLVGRHGHPTVVERPGISFIDGRPVVYPEAGTQELHPNAGGRGFDGLSPIAGYSKLATGMVDEDTVSHPHRGTVLMKNMKWWNVGEVQSNEDGFPVLDANGIPVVLDGRTVIDPEQRQHQIDGQTLLSIPKSLGNSRYRLLVEVGIPFTSLKKKIKDERFDSPESPLFNSAKTEPNILKDTQQLDKKFAEIIKGKMWTGSFGERGGVDGDTSWGDEARTATTCKVSAGADGNRLAWEAVPYAHAYVIRIDAPGMTQELAVPGYTGQLDLKGLGHVTHYEHNESSGWEPGVKYTYSVSAVWSKGERRMPVIGN